MTHARIPDFSQPACLRPASAASRQNLAANSLLTIEKTASRFRGLPHEILPGSIEPWEAVAGIRPDTPHSRALRFLNVMGEGLTALVLIAGGVFAYGYLPTL